MKRRKRGREGRTGGTGTEKRGGWRQKTEEGIYWTKGESKKRGERERERWEEDRRDGN